MQRWWIAVASFAVSTVAAAGEPTLVWPQFRGPQGSGVAEIQMPPLEFGPEKNVRWKVAVPPGFSSPIVAGGNLVLTAFDGGKLYTIAYRRSDGKEVWRREAPAQRIELHHSTEGSPAASTPATDGKRIVSYFGSCGLFCYDLDGKELWRYELPTAATLADFGTGVSPLIVDGTVVVVRDQAKDSKILAVDVETGTLRWEVKRQSPASHSTPVVWESPEGKQIVAPGAGRMIGYDVKTGAEKWWVNGMPSMCCASPVVADGKLFLAAWSPGEDFLPPAFDALLSQAGEEKLGHLTKEGVDKTVMKGFFSNHDVDKDGRITRQEWDDAMKYLSQTRNSAMSVKAGGAGDVTLSHILWRKPRAKGLPYVPSAIYYRGQYVMVKDGGIVTAYHASSGDELYMKRAAATGRYYASPVAANGYIYFTSLDEGVVTVVEAGGVTPKVVAQNTLQERTAATPAIADDSIYFRTAGHLYAFGDAR